MSEPTEQPDPAFLLTPQSQEWLARAAAMDQSPQARLTNLTLLRRSLTPEQAGAVLEQAELRRAAASKFSRAGAMLFTRAGLEQASAEVVAAHRARRFAGRGLVADLTCGIGADALALAGAARQVIGLDLSLPRLLFARHNARAYDRELLTAQADLLVPPFTIDALDAAFADPGRRGAEGKRIFSPEDYSPPLSVVLARYAGVDLAVKVAPGIDYAALAWAGEVEIVSLHGDVKEAVLWSRGLATLEGGRRATLLPHGDSLTSTDAPGDCPLTEPQQYIYEPDGAIIRAGLVRNLAHTLGLAQIDPQIAYLTGAAAIKSPFMQGFAVDEAHPFNLKLLNRRLRELNVGTLELKKRGSAIEPESLRGRLKLSGPESRTIIFTRIGDRHIMLLCRRLA